MRVSSVRHSTSRLLGNGREEDVESGGGFVGEEGAKDDLKVSGVARALRWKKGQTNLGTVERTESDETHEVMDEEEHVVRKRLGEEVGRAKIPSAEILQ